MGYYVRAFCTHGEVPSLRAVLAFSAEQGARLDVDPEASEPEIDDGTWEHAAIVYKDHKAPILLEVNQDDSNEGSLVS